MGVLSGGLAFGVLSGGWHGGFCLVVAWGFVARGALCPRRVPFTHE